MVPLATHAKHMASIIYCVCRVYNEVQSVSESILVRNKRTNAGQKSNLALPAPDIFIFLFDFILFDITSRRLRKAVT
jgi:hypothetical protein